MLKKVTCTVQLLGGIVNAFFLNFITEEVLIQIRKEWYSFLTISKCSQAPR